MKKKVKNPFAQNNKNEDYHCFGCSPFNEIGLKLSFSVLDDELIESIWKPKAHFEGFYRVLHGGIQATLHDETAAWLVFTKCKTSGVTQSLNINYLKPVYITDNQVRTTARLIQVKEKKAIISTKLFNSNNELCSEGEVTYFIFPEAIAKRKYNYPGVEAFFD